MEICLGEGSNHPSSSIHSSSVRLINGGQVSVKTIFLYLPLEEKEFTSRCWHAADPRSVRSVPSGVQGGREPLIQTHPAEHRRPFPALIRTYACCLLTNEKSTWQEKRDLFQNLVSFHAAYCWNPYPSGTAFERKQISMFWNRAILKFLTLELIRSIYRH